MNEIWKPIPDCDGYFASNKGRIKNENTKTIFKNYINNKGYAKISIIDGGIRKTKSVSRLVASAFHGKNDKKMVLHTNGNPADNRPENLRYGTAKENYDDARKHGTNSKGNNHGRSILKESDIQNIRNEYSSGNATYKEIGNKYGVTKYTIFRVINGDNWKWVN